MNGSTAPVNGVNGASSSVNGAAAAAAAGDGGAAGGSWRAPLPSVFRFTDSLHPNAAAAMAELRSAGKEIMMLTGDNASSARVIAGKVGIPEEAVHASLTPADKLKLVERARKVSRCKLTSS